MASQLAAATGPRIPGWCRYCNQNKTKETGAQRWSCKPRWDLTLDRRAATLVRWLSYDLLNDVTQDNASLFVPVVHNHTDHVRVLVTPLSPKDCLPPLKTLVRSAHVEEDTANPCEESDNYLKNSETLAPWREQDFRRAVHGEQSTTVAKTPNQQLPPQEKVKQTDNSLCLLPNFSLVKPKCKHIIYRLLGI